MVSIIRDALQIIHNTGKTYLEVKAANLGSEHSLLLLNTSKGYNVLF